MANKHFQFLLLVSVLLIATCGLIYELVAGTLASYLLGDSVTQFSTVIGAYLFAMGIGSYLSRFLDGDLMRWFIRVELLVGTVGGFSSIALFAAFNWVDAFRVVLYALVGLTGIFVGLEIPVLMRIFNDQKLEFKELVSRVFTFDYLGALFASLIFPLVLVPQLGLIRTSLFFGLVNIAMALFIIHKIPEGTRKYRLLQVVALLLVAVMGVCFALSDRIQSYTEQKNYSDNILYSNNSHYQRIVITADKNLCLFLNGNLQFNSLDEYRYHESLVHPIVSMAPSIKRVCVMGGGDGLALREILKYPEVEKIVLVDLDQQLTRLFSESKLLSELNGQAMTHPKVEVVNADAFRWITEQGNASWDLLVVDFPDPSSFGLGKLYSTTFYAQAKRVLSENGSMVVQSTSPFYAPQSFWCIDTTLQASGFYTLPYHCLVPSFGEWGFILANKQPTDKAFQRPLPKGLRFFSAASFEGMTHFPIDMKKRPAEINKLNNQKLVAYFDAEWKKLN